MDKLQEIKDKLIGMLREKINYGTINIDVGYAVTRGCRALDELNEYWLEKRMCISCIALDNNINLRGEIAELKEQLVKVEYGKQLQEEMTNKLSKELAEVQKLKSLDIDDVYECLSDELDYDTTTISQARAICDTFGTNIPSEKWISVKNELPEINTPVLAIRLNENNHKPYMLCMMRAEVEDGWVWCEQSFVTDFNEIEEYMFEDDYNVTYWMPLPNLPSEGDSNVTR